MYNPTGSYILLRPIEESEVSSGGIIIPEQARAKSNEGYVESHGPNVCNVTSFPIGAKVVFATHQEYRIKMDGKIRILVEENHILLVEI
jgi:co-chaperonin GroES (HSP10)